MRTPLPSEWDPLKRAAATTAVTEVEDGIVVGLDLGLVAKEPLLIAGQPAPDMQRGLLHRSNTPRYEKFSSTAGVGILPDRHLCRGDLDKMD
jgi:hypothetical protein